MAVFANNHLEAPDPEILSDIYIDESSQTKHRYLLLGGVILPTRGVLSAKAEFDRLRLPELPHGEMKWNKVSNSKLMAYKRVVDGFFDRPQFTHCHFHSLIVDTHAINHAAFNDGSREVGFNKEIYQLASKFARLYHTRLLHLYMDSRDTNQRPDDLRNILNFGRRKVGDNREWPFRRSHFRDSKDTAFLQIVDILLGGLGYQINGHINAPNSSEAKSRLSRYILRKAGISDVMVDTSRSGKFTVWHRQLRE